MKRSGGSRAWRRLQHERSDAPFFFCFFFCVFTAETPSILNAKKDAWSTYSAGALAPCCSCFQVVQKTELKVKVASLGPYPCMHA